MKAEDLKTKTPDELKKTLLDLKKEQMEMRFQLGAGQLENGAKLRDVRRNIARVHTVMNASKADAKAAKPAKAKAKTETETKARPAKKAAAKKTKAA